MTQQQQVLKELLVTSLDNDEVVAGDAVSLGDTNVTTTDADGIYTGTGLNGGSNHILEAFPFWPT